MDIIKICISPNLYAKWPEGGLCQEAEILINGEPLIEIVRRTEYPHAIQEFDERIADGELPTDLAPRGSFAGDYMYLPAHLTFLPSQNFFGAPYERVAKESYPVNEKSLILGCSCGIIECWFLLAKITIDRNTVTWSDFEQFHRDWEYDLAFVFNREHYESVFTVP